MKIEIQGPSFGVWILILFCIAVLIIALLFHVVATPHGPTRLALIAKPYPTLRLCFIYLPSYIESHMDTLWSAYYYEFQLITDPLVQHLVIELWRRGALKYLFTP